MEDGMKEDNSPVNCRESSKVRLFCQKYTCRYYKNNTIQTLKKSMYIFIYDMEAPLRWHMPSIA